MLITIDCACLEKNKMTEEIIYMIGGEAENRDQHAVSPTMSQGQLSTVTGCAPR
jgi:hypothetical protein